MHLPYYRWTEHVPAAGYIRLFHSDVALAFNRIEENAGDQVDWHARGMFFVMSLVDIGQSNKLLSSTSAGYLTSTVERCIKQPRGRGTRKSWNTPAKAIVAARIVPQAQTPSPQSSAPKPSSSMFRTPTEVEIERSNRENFLNAYRAKFGHSYRYSNEMLMADVRAWIHFGDITE